MSSYPTATLHALNRVPEESSNSPPPGDITPTHGGLVVGHEFDFPITQPPRSHFSRDPSPLRPTTPPTLNTIEKTPEATQTPTPPVTPLPLSASSHSRTPSTSHRTRPASMPAPASTTPSTLKPPPATEESSNAPSKRTASESRSRGSNRVLGDYTLGKTLGAGSMGKVKLAHHNQTQEKVGVLAPCLLRCLWEHHDLHPRQSAL
jgi:hypothetical protein